MRALLSLLILTLGLAGPRPLDAQAPACASTDVVSRHAADASDRRADAQS